MLISIYNKASYPIQITVEKYDDGFNYRKIQGKTSTEPINVTKEIYNALKRNPCLKITIIE